MSTPATQQTNNFTGRSKIREKEQLAIKFRVNSVKARPESDTSNYDSIDIIAVPVDGSRKMFPCMFYRPEWFRADFSPDSYVNPEHPDYSDAFAEVYKTRDNGDEVTLGQSYDGMFTRNMDPTVVVKKGVRTAQSITTITAIAGGTLAGFESLMGAVAEASQTPDWTVTAKDGSVSGPNPEQVAGVINSWLQENPGEDQFAICKQARGMDGNLSDNYEIGSYRGPVDQESEAGILKQIEKNATGPVARRIKKGWA